MNDATRAETLLKVEDVTLVLGDRVILREVNAEIRNVIRPGLSQGQVVSLLGPSGIGKTQLFRIMAGLQKPSRGKVLVTEKALPVEAGMVGVVDQHYTLFAHRTVGDNLLIAGRQGGLPRARAEARARELLGRLKLAERWDEWPANLSGGQRQRVAIAQQLLCSEHYLLMDEPFSGLDPNMKDEVCELIAEVAALHELTTILVITHDIASAITISDTLWLLGRDPAGEDGKVHAGARVQGVYDLVERGLAWRPEVQTLPAFRDLSLELRARFRTL
ncbi:MAG: ABC transporter ATP-binding protein [Deltaproteobacteria bacterium]|nr:ABC transporter ATP-binding protein [Deltaproteobacteria bacterium]